MMMAQDPDMARAKWYSEEDGWMDRDRTETSKKGGLGCDVHIYTFMLVRGATLSPFSWSFNTSGVRGHPSSILS